MGGRYVLPFFFPLAFCFAQRRFTASAILARPSEERFLFFLPGLDSAGVTAFFLGRPRSTVRRATELWEAATRDRARFRRAISASI